jgi:hypothetical protein
MVSNSKRVRVQPGHDRQGLPNERKLCRLHQLLDLREDVDRVGAMKP